MRLVALLISISMGIAIVSGCEPEPAPAGDCAMDAWRYEDVINTPVIGGYDSECVVTDVGGNVLGTIRRDHSVLNYAATSDRTGITTHHRLIDEAAAKLVQVACYHGDLSGRNCVAALRSED